MIRVILYLIIIAALGLGFGWLADRPGDLVFTFAGERHHLTLMVAASIVVAAIAVAMFMWWLVKSVIRSPDSLRRHSRARKRDRGYQSLSTGLIAAGAGDAETARRMSKQASKLLNTDQEPLLYLLDVQTALLEGRKEDMRRHFEAMIADPETKLLGLRGLYLEACREGAREAAFQYAQEAVVNAPQLEWASKAVLGHKVLEGDISGGLQVLDARKATIPFGRDGKAARDALKNDRAILLTAQAMAVFDSDPATARAAAAEAYKLSPELVPASLIAARCLLRDGQIRKGNRILEASWKQNTHPEIAETYVYGRHGDAALDRLKKARHLASLRPDNAQSALVVARAALDAGEMKLARDKATRALDLAPSESAYLLMADIEEAQTGDQGRVRQWLGLALKAPRDAAWTADGVISRQWAPVSPVTGRLNAFEWKVPLAELRAGDAPVLDAKDFSADLARDLAAEPYADDETSDDVIGLRQLPSGKDDIAEAQTIDIVASVQDRKTDDPVKSDTGNADINRAVKPKILPDISDNPVAVAAREQAKATEATLHHEEQHTKHGLIVDDPGVPETKKQQKTETAFRLF